MATSFDTALQNLLAHFAIEPIKNDPFLSQLNTQATVEALITAQQCLYSDQRFAITNSQGSVHLNLAGQCLQHYIDARLEKHLAGLEEK